MHCFLVVVEKADENYFAYSPGLPGCVATSETHEEVEENIYEAIKMYIEGLKEDHLPIPKLQAETEYAIIG